MKNREKRPRAWPPVACGLTSAGGALAGGGEHVGDAATLLQRDVEALLAFEAVDAHVVGLAQPREVRPLLDRGGRSDLPPRSVAQVRHAVAVPQPVLQR